MEFISEAKRLFYLVRNLDLIGHLARRRKMPWIGSSQPGCIECVADFEDGVVENYLPGLAEVGDGL